jgi:hypothetical protein
MASQAEYQTNPQITPQTPRASSCWASRDERLAARTLRAQNQTYARIAAQTGLTQRQVQLACSNERPTPRKPRGQRLKLSEEQLDEVIEFITSSKEARRMPYKEVTRALQLPVCKATLRKALARRGYHRCKALRKPPLSERTRALRLTWALEHVNWTREQWLKVMSTYGDHFTDLSKRSRAAHFGPVVNEAVSKFFAVCC